jgi:hypothetical protein
MVKKYWLRAWMIFKKTNTINQNKMLSMASDFVSILKQLMILEVMYGFMLKAMEASIKLKA